MSTPNGLTVNAADLDTGDHLLRLGGVGYAQLHDPDATPVIICDVRPPAEEAEADDPIVEIVTSAGTMYARASAPALIKRNTAVTPQTILLVGRRRMLHSRLMEFGVPVVRRTPVDPGKNVAPVTPTEWLTAPLIVIDGYLSRATITQMWNRGDLHDRDQIIMVGTDPDDVRVYARQGVAKARQFFLLPYDKSNLSNLFHAAIRSEADRDPYMGILTPHARRP